MGIYKKLMEMSALLNLWYFLIPHVCYVKSPNRGIVWVSIYADLCKRKNQMRICTGFLTA